MVKKLYISADIEGTAGIAHWNETDKVMGASDGYAHFATQMSREVAAACEGAFDAGCEDVLVKDAHDSARNINPELLPERARIMRGWSQDVLVMMSGLDESFDGVAFTGYHSPVGTGANPLAHTMTPELSGITLNGEILSELHISCLIASMFGVPVYCVTGDKALCDWIKTKNEHIMTVAVSEGFGNASTSIHPSLAVKRIREAVREALIKPKEQMMFPMPDRYCVEVSYKQHHVARRMANYPGAVQAAPHTICFDSTDYMDVLKFFLFVL